MVRTHDKLRLKIFQKLLGYRLKPIVEVVDLKNNALSITLKREFVKIKRVIFQIVFATSSPDFTKFGVDNALTDPIQIVYEGETIISIKKTNDLQTYAYDVSNLQDAAATKNNSIVARYTFTKFVPGGLDFFDKTNTDFEIIKPDLSGSSNVSITMTFEGWGWNK